MSEAKMQKVILTSNDGASIEVDRAVAERSMLLKNMIDDLGEEAIGSNPIPIPNVSLFLKLLQT